MVKHTSFRTSSSLLILLTACPLEPEPDELCEGPSIETGTDGDTGNETVGPEYMSPDRVPITDPDTLESHPFRTIVQIVMEIPAGDGFGTWLCRGTGALVGPRHVLTNHHVVANCNDIGIGIEEMLMMNPPEDGFVFQVFPGRAPPDPSLNGGAWNVESVVWGPQAWTNSYGCGSFWAGRNPVNSYAYRTCTAREDAWGSTFGVRTAVTLAQNRGQS